MSRLWRKRADMRGGKYLVKRRDGSIPEWPGFLIGARDPCAPAALLAYADAAESRGLDPEFVDDIRELAVEFREYADRHGHGDPDAPPHRKDDPSIIAEMEKGGCA